MSRRAVRKAIEGVLTTIMVTALLGLGGVPAASGTEPPSSGWNDWGCRPAPAHPNPVILLHGLSGSADSWNALANHLINNEYCVFSLTYGQAPPIYYFGGTGPVVDSAVEVSGFLDEVLAATGATQVDLVGHSLGGFLALYVPKNLERADEVGTVVTISTDPHSEGPIGPTDLVDLLGLRPVPEALTGKLGCRACTDILPGSAVRQELTTGPIAQIGVRYTLIHSRTDAFVAVGAPLGSPFLEEPGVTNHFVQGRCPLNLVGHTAMPADTTVVAMVANALDPDNPGRVPCGIGLPI